MFGFLIGVAVTLGFVYASLTKQNNEILSEIRECIREMHSCYRGVEMDFRGIEYKIEELKEMAGEDIELEKGSGK